MTARGNGGRIVGVFDASTSPPRSGVGGGSVRGRIWNNVDQPLGNSTPKNLVAIGSCSGMDSIDGGSDQPFGGSLPLMSEFDSKPPRAEAWCPLAGESLALPKSVESGNLSFSNRPPVDVG